MIYVFILGIWMILNCIVQVINDISISKKVYSSILGQVVKYAIWFWLIYEISQEF